MPASVDRCAGLLALLDADARARPPRRQDFPVTSIAPSPARPAATRRSSRAAATLWTLAAVVVTGAVAAARLLPNPRFYFADDTQVGSFGQWWELGDRLLSGGIPVLDPQAWQAGNYFAEGQWGLLNPLTWIIALAARASEHPALLTAVVKIAFLMLLALGTVLLARSFGATDAWAALAGVLVPLAGFTVYMDAASWSTGLFNAALIPWAWWGLRRCVEEARSPLPYLASSYLLITFGYVFGVLILVILLVETLVRAIVAKDRARILSAIVASAWGALLTIAIYLPGVLTAPVTERAGFSIINTGFLNADLNDLAASASPTATASVSSWWGATTDAPLVYVAWVLPLFPLFLPMARAAVMRCIPLLVLATLMLIVVIGPSQIGPIRWPVRFMPYLVLAVVVLFAVAASRAFPALVTRRKMLWSFVVLVLTTGLTFANTPSGWRGMLFTMIVQAIAIAAIAWVATTPRPIRTDVRTTLAAAASIVVSAALVVPQMAVFPATPLPNFGAPDSVSRMSAVLEGIDGDAIVVGDIYAEGGRAASFDERLMGNLWYLSDADVSSLYTVLPYSTFSRDLCTDLRGSTCAEALDTLWSTDPDSGETVADLMGVSTIVAITATFPEAPEPAPGWSLDRSGAFTWLYTRDATAPPAGGIAWTGEGTRVTVEEQGDASLAFRVDEVGSDARVVLSRLDYPGYGIGGAARVDPLRGWLLTVDVSGAQPGDLVTVSFRPPGFAAMIVAGGLAAVILVGWPILVSRQRRRKPGEGVIADPAAPSAGPGTPG